MLYRSTECRFIHSVYLIVERKPKAGHPEEETPADQDRVQLGAFLLQVNGPVLLRVSSVVLFVRVCDAQRLRAGFSWITLAPTSSGT